MKSKQELIEKWESAIGAAEFYGKGKEERLISYMKDFVSDLNQLDEPETLTPEWIDERIHYSTDQDAFGNIVRIEMVPAKYLQNLLVPKQEYFLDTLEDGVYAVKDGRIERGNIATEYTNKETEVLSQKWIDDNSVYASSDGITEEYVHVDDLKELLVPKQEELEVKIQELIETYKQEDGAYSNPENGWISGFITDLEYLLKEEQKYYVVKSEGLDGVHYYFTKFDDEMNGLFTLPNDKKGAYRFDDKEKAQTIANYTDSKVEELEE